MNFKIQRPGSGWEFKLNTRKDRKAMIAGIQKLEIESFTSITILLNSDINVDCSVIGICICSSNAITLMLIKLSFCGGIDPLDYIKEKNGAEIILKGLIWGYINFSTNIEILDSNFNL